MNPLEKIPIILEGLESVSERHLQCLRLKEEWVKRTILSQATPPIKGEVTKGKLRWRGIHQKIKLMPNQCMITELWQRDKCLGVYREVFSQL